MSFNERIQQAADECKHRSWVIHDASGDVDTDADGIDLSLWMGNNNVTDNPTNSTVTTTTTTATTTTTTTTTTDFSKEWAILTDPFLDESSMDSTDSLMYTKHSDADDDNDYDDDDEKEHSQCKRPSKEENGQDNDHAYHLDRCHELWCHESQVEDVPGHKINLGSASLLEFMEMKDECAAGLASVKIQLSGGLIGERINFRYDEQGKPLPLYVNCLQEPKWWLAV